MSAKSLSFGRRYHLGAIAIALAISVTASCSLIPDWSGRATGGHLSSTQRSPATVREPIPEGGLAIGFVVNQVGAPPLKLYQRQRYADQIAAQILSANPQLDGKVDSYRYVSRQMGEAFKGFVEQYRQHGTLDSNQRGLIIGSKFRRRYLMLVSISPVDEKLQLPPVVKPVASTDKGKVPDYQIVSYQTARVKKVTVEIYDTRTARLLRSEEVSSTDGGRAVVNERKGRRYIGNSLLGAMSNALANKFRYGDGNVKYPAPPSVSYTLNYIWELIARDMPRKVIS